ncbi:hypothetical protein [Actinomycetospora chlora]|uniref:hypothetical protein n=1 Tax=Actinomycetospora chlora TaxID=663608 RepID=UPI0031E973FA
MPWSLALSETPCDPLPTVRDERRGRRSRFAASLGVGLVGAASLTTAVYQTITQSSTTVGLPGEVAEVDTPLPWAAAGAPAGLTASPTTITPTVADLDLRADQQPLPAAPAPPAAAGPAGTPSGPPVSAAGPVFTPSARDDRPAPSSGTATGRPSGTSGTTEPSTGSGTSGTPTSGTPTPSTPTSQAPSSEAPSSEPPSSETPSSESPSSGTPSSGTPSSGSGAAEPSTPADGG